MTRSDALNLEAIKNGIDKHDTFCSFPVLEIRMNPFECERLGWDEVLGIQVVPDEKMGTGRFRLVCDRPPVDEHDPSIEKELLVT